MADLVAGLNNVASTGTLIGAAMETAGHYMQAKLLDEFEGDFGKKLGGLLYLIAIIGALITVTSGASYRYALYLLIGPPLYYFLITVRSDSNGAEWRFGQKNFGTSTRDKVLDGVAPPSGYRVSLFFKAWDKLVSDMVQGFVELTALTDDDRHISFINKGDRFFNALTSNPGDPKLIEFINAALVNHCQQYFFAKLQLANPGIPDDRKTGLRSFINKFDATNKIIQLKTNHPALLEWLKMALQDNSIADSYTCDEGWKLGIRAFKTVSAGTFKDYVTRIAVVEGESPNVAKAKLEKSFGRTTGVPGAIENADESRFGMMVNEIAARMLVKELSSVKPHLAQLDTTDLGLPTNSGAGMDYEQDTVRAMRVLSANDEYQYKGELIMGALTLPYIQGSVLFFLAVTFPFFALMMVIPGRHSAMFLWMSLWVWAKLWDLGFAVVMMIDNMMYALFPHGELMTQAKVDDPGLAMQIVFQTDPGYSAHTYYNLLSCCLISVPFVCGFLVHKGGGDILEGVQGAFKDFPTRFGTTMAAFQRSIFAQHELATVHRARVMDVANNAWAGLKADSEITDRVDASQRLSQIAAAVKMGKGVLGSGTLEKALQGNRFTAEALGRLNGLTGPALEAEIADLQSKNEYQLGLAGKRHHFNMANLAYKAGKTREANLHASLAVLSNYNSHDFRNNFAFPDAPLRNMLMAERMTPNAGALFSPWYGPMGGQFKQGFP